MKSIISFLFCCQVIYITYGQNCSLSGDLSILQTVRPCYAGSWVLEFEDNFAGGELDLDKWRPLYNYGQKDELAYMTPNNHVFASHSANLINSAYGVLKLESKVKSIGGRSFSSGMIESKGLFGYGKYEIRCKIPSGNGHWPAFWIFGHNTPWEEVDFFEFNFSRKDNENDKVHTALHYSSPTAPSGEEGCGGVWSDGTDYSASFHTFTTIYGPTQTDWFVDGVLISTVVRWYNILGQAVPCKNLIVPQLYSQNLAYPKGAPSNIIINSTIGNENADLPNTFEIDYVRFYSQPTYCGGQAVLVNPTGGAMGCIDWNHPEITVKNNYIESGCNVNMKAGRAIHMKPPYFHVKAGATFSARIECNSSNKMALPNAYDDLESEVVTLKSKNPIFSNELLNNNQSNLVTVYPNPTKEKFNIKINGYYDTIVTLKLSDLLGQTIFTTTGKQNSFSFNLSKYPKGIYLLKTTIGAKIDLQKVVYQ